MLEIEQLRIDSFYIILSFYQILLSSRILVFYCIEYIYIYSFIFYTKTGTISSLTFFPRRKVSTFSNNNNKEEARTPRAIPGYHSKRGTVVFFTCILLVFFFPHISTTTTYLDMRVYRDEKEPRMLCTMRKINRENTLWWLVRRKGNLGQEFFDVPPHWRSE